MEDQIPQPPKTETPDEREVRILRNALTLIENCEVRGVGQANAIVEMGQLLNSYLATAFARIPHPASTPVETAPAAAALDAQPAPLPENS